MKWTSSRIHKWNSALLVNAASVFTVTTRDKPVRTRVAMEPRHMAAVLRDSNDAITMQDFNGKIIAWNRGAERMYGYTEDEALGLKILDLVPEDKRAEAEELGAPIARGETIPTIETQRTTKDGRRLDVSLTVTVLVDDDGIPLGFATTERDITEHMQYETALRSAKKEADCANHFKSEFLALMSHELRTPLNAIIGFSEMLGGGYLGSLTNKQKEYISDIHGAGHHLLDVINDILDLSKAEAGKMELDTEVLDVTQIIEACLRLMRERAANAGVCLNVKIIGDLPFLKADKRKLKQILINLLSNAVKFTPRGGSVTVKVTKEPDGCVAIAVTDTGIGMSTEDVPKVMNAYVRANSMTKREGEGTGLGLPLTKTLVELHGGSLDLRSVLGGGTTVMVRFPADRIVAAPVDTRSLLEADRKAS
jgi:PAS domain S-box-containing protein